ncbi:helix-turn-helix domain-containing protein [Haloechinothrix halophila]|uniref:helix-turn-helix domain-containing protein n=1 Tax=Haloechinothrix halophila TaxID=1069073 RepID=UPI0004091C21|nr:helix-turn-helix transcriptional regulator [Haloechinothrix halophila]
MTFEQRAEFGEHLRNLRLQAGFHEAKVFAEHLGWNPPKVSKIENGRQVASDTDLDEWLAATDVDEETAEQLRAELSAVRDERIAWKQQVRAGHRARQDEALDLESAAKSIRAVELAVVPGLLQTADYARHVLLASASLHGGNQDIADAVRARMRRQQVLYEPGKSLEFIIAEAALTHPIAPPEVMTGQIHRLIATIGAPNLRLGVLPVGTQLPFPLVNGYWIVDRLVMVETLTFERRITDPDEVQTYIDYTDRLWKVAAEGDDARTILTRLTG